MDFNTTTYCLLPQLSFVSLNCEQGVLIGPRGAVAMKGMLYVQVLEALQQQPATVVGLMERLKKKLPTPYVLHAHKELMKLGYIGDLHTHKDPAYVAVPELKELPLLNWKVNKEDIPEISILRTLSDDNAKREYTRVLSTGKKWLPIVIGTERTTIGPVFYPDAGACPECLAFRLRQNQSLFTYFEQQGGVMPRQVAQDLIQSTICTLEYFTQHWDHEGELFGKIIAVNSDGIRTFHEVYQRPECPQCGNPNLMTEWMQQEILLAPSSGYLSYKNGYRSVSSEKTWTRLQHHIDPVCGVLKDLYNLSTSDHLQTFKISYPVMPMTEIPALYEFSIEAYGKGRTEKDAQVSALCEAVERASARYYGNEPIVKASISELRGAVSPLDIQHFHQEQLLAPDHTYALGPIPKMFDENEETEWLPAWSLRDRQQCYVPADAVLYGSLKTAKNRVAVFESNGFSAGNTLEEAITQGLLELIERDAVAIWWFNRLKRPPFESTMLEKDSWFTTALSELNDQGCTVHFLDLTIDTGVPVVAAVGEFETGFLIGYGCHLDSRIALSRGLTELIQVKTLMKPVPSPFEQTDYLYPDDTAKTFHCIHCNFDDEQEVFQVPNKLVKRLAQLDLDTVVVNCTRPDIGFPVVKVFVPGLRAFRPRFGEGRLYRVPVECGLLDVPTKYEELNPMWLTMRPYQKKTQMVDNEDTAPID